MDFVPWPQRLGKEQAETRRDVCTSTELGKLTMSTEFLNYVKSEKDRSLSPWTVLGFCLACSLVGVLAGQVWRFAPVKSYEVPQARTETGAESLLSGLKDAEANEWFANMKLRESETKGLLNEQKISELENKIKRDLQGSAWYDSHRSKEPQNLSSHPRSPQSLRLDISLHDNAATFQENVSHQPFSISLGDLAMLKDYGASEAENPNKDEVKTVEDTWVSLLAVLLIALLPACCLLYISQSDHKMRKNILPPLQEQAARLAKVVKKAEEASRHLAKELQHARETVETTSPSSESVVRLHTPFLLPADKTLIVILLNYKLPGVAPDFWNKAQYRICADGAANILYQQASVWAKTMPDAASSWAKSRFRPDLIKGDMDSIRSEVCQHFKSAGSRIEDDSKDQDSTDLQKCIWGGESWLKNEGIPTQKAMFLALGAFGGRLDHTISNLSSLYKNPHLDVVLLGDGSMARLLPEGKSEITTSESEGPHCGIVALGDPAKISSKGLQWDMDDTELKVGGLLSTSNRFVSKTVSIISDKPVLWMTEMVNKENGS